MAISVAICVAICMTIGTFRRLFLDLLVGNAALYEKLKKLEHGIEIATVEVGEWPSEQISKGAEGKGPDDIGTPEDRGDEAATSSEKF